jgi:hypothetical protein
MKDRLFKYGSRGALIKEINLLEEIVEMKKTKINELEFKLAHYEIDKPV